MESAELAESDIEELSPVRRLGLEYGVIDRRAFRITSQKLIEFIREDNANKGEVGYEFCSPEKPGEILSRRGAEAVLLDFFRSFGIKNKNARHEREQAFLFAVRRTKEEVASGIFRVRGLARIFAILLDSFKNPDSSVWHRFFDLCYGSYKDWTIYSQRCSSPVRTASNDASSPTYPGLLADRHLPLTKGRFEMYFGNQPGTFDDFNRGQYVFCPVVLQPRGSVAYTSPRKKPCRSPYIGGQEFIGEGSFGMVYRVAISRELLPLDQISTSGSTEGPNLYARKEFKVAKKAFEEWDFGYKILNQKLKNDNIMPTLAVLIKTEDVHLFFPLAVCNLQEYMQRPLDRTSDFGAYCLDYEENRKNDSDEWYQETIRKILDIGKAIKFLHDDVEDPENGEHVSCYHLDLKPSNILIVREGNGEIFKIADFSISRAKPKDKDVRDLSKSIIRRKRTREQTTWNQLANNNTCIAPEGTFKDGRVNSAADVWAFGCVLTMILAWLFSENGLDQLVHERLEGNRQASNESRDWFFTRHTLNTDRTAGDVLGIMDDDYGAPDERIFKTNVRVLLFLDECITRFRRHGQYQREKLFLRIKDILEKQVLVPAFRRDPGLTSRIESVPAERIRGSMKDVNEALQEAYKGFRSQEPLIYEFEVPGPRDPKRESGSRSKRDSKAQTPDRAVTRGQPSPGHVSDAVKSSSSSAKSSSNTEDLAGPLPWRTKPLAREASPPAMLQCLLQVDEDVLQCVASHTGAYIAHRTTKHVRLFPLNRETMIIRAPTSRSAAPSHILDVEWSNLCLNDDMLIGWQHTTRSSARSKSAVVTMHVYKIKDHKLSEPQSIEISRSQQVGLAAVSNDSRRVAFVSFDKPGQQGASDSCTLRVMKREGATLRFRDEHKVPGDFSYTRDPKTQSMLAFSKSGDRLIHVCPLGGEWHIHVWVLKDHQVRDTGLNITMENVSDRLDANALPDFTSVSFWNIPPPCVLILQRHEARRYEIEQGSNSGFDRSPIKIPGYKLLRCLKLDAHGGIFLCHKGRNSPLEIVQHPGPKSSPNISPHNPDRTFKTLNTKNWDHRQDIAVVLQIAQDECYAVLAGREGVVEALLLPSLEDT